MPFKYYRSLNAQQKAIYRISDAIASIPLPDAVSLRWMVGDIKIQLSQSNRLALEKACRQLVRGITVQLATRPVRIRVLAARPHNDYGELHGLYERPLKGRTWPVITVWMRTAKRQQVVAFKTFLRTVLHELCHHLDYDHLELADSLHTEGFYQRETSLFKQLIGGR